MPMSGKDLLRLAGKSGWRVIRQKGSHVRVEHIETKLKTAIVVHSNKDLPKGTEQALVKRLGLN
ncbi:type II toxin-antitoxin system HicA family toxin [Enterococcus sp. 669A]|uniref:Type II toxin-antitoxin system HicA family toxin n=1 Tax=Candidatus Enterococcus moelleringii TaxID=2815325 RepID=A0ABS3L9N7_9ENTE|nr:type II toxin-antitoxin system HicA family toxin [Enterococcus sp. 669A]MBO1306320.1 type II toxin-antitoxin system HicA family toxin [Enterococcus sp. 669A]